MSFAIFPPGFVHLFVEGVHFYFVPWGNALIYVPHLSGNTANATNVQPFHLCLFLLIAFGLLMMEISHLLLFSNGSLSFSGLQKDKDTERMDSLTNDLQRPFSQFQKLPFLIIQYE